MTRLRRMARLHRSDAGISRFPVLFTLVGIIFVATVVSLVLVHNQNKSSGNRPVSDRQVSTSPSAAVTTTAPTTASSTPSASAPSSTVARIPVATPSVTYPVTVKPATTPRKASTPDAARSATYVVKKGDNLFVIAQWFKLHGYGDLYDRNKAVIGADPNLIKPGQRITVSSTGMMTSTR